MALRYFCSRGLTGWADSKKFKLMGHIAEVVSMRNTLFQGVRKTIANFDYLPALLANKMMVVPVIITTEQFIAR